MALYDFKRESNERAQNPDNADELVVVDHERVVHPVNARL